MGGWTVMSVCWVGGDGWLDSNECVGWVGMGGWAIMSVCWVGGGGWLGSNDYVLGGWRWVVGQ